MTANWQLEVEGLLKWDRGRSDKARVGSIVSFLVVVYCTWQERNQRVFQHKFRNVNGILRDIERDVRAKM